MSVLKTIDDYKTRILGVITVGLGFIQAYPGLNELLSPTAYARTMFVIGLLVTICGYLNKRSNDSEPTNTQGGYARVLLLCVLTVLSVGMATQLQGCASIGLKSPETPAQRLAYAYSQNTAIRTTATAALNVGQLSSADGEYVLKVTNESRALLDAAALAIGVGDFETAEGRLLLVTGILAQLQSYLNSKGAP